MGDRTQRVKGKINEVTGKTKRAAGYQRGDTATEAKGAAQTLKGKTQQAVGKARGTVKKKTR
ncbi:MAG: CsbD family protein [Actinobacteria bacterium]|nr:MAG: CsbD family protein [Actinomycetota bacterium]